MNDPTSRPKIAKGTRGRFNYLSFRPGVYDVIFREMEGKISITVATGLTFDQAKELMEDLNEVIDDFREELL